MRLTFTHGYLGLFLVTFVCLPFLGVAYEYKHETAPQSVWLEALIGSSAIVAALLYTAYRCSARENSYWLGLLVIAQSVAAGTTYFSIIIGFPILFVAVVLSIIYTAIGSLVGSPTFAVSHYRKLVNRIYDHRLHQ